MTIARKFHQCHECRSTIQIGQHYSREANGKLFHSKCMKLRVNKPKLKQEEKRRNTKMQEQNIKLRNLIMFLTLISFVLFAVDDGYAACFVLAFIGWVFYVVNYCEKKDEKRRT